MRIGLPRRSLRSAVRYFCVRGGERFCLMKVSKGDWVSFVCFEVMERERSHEMSDQVRLE